MAEQFAEAVDVLVQQRLYGLRVLSRAVKPVPPVISTTCTFSLAIQLHTRARICQMSS